MVKDINYNVDSRCIVTGSNRSGPDYADNEC